MTTYYKRKLIIFSQPQLTNLSYNFTIKMQHFSHKLRSKNAPIFDYKILNQGANLVISLANFLLLPA